MQKYTVFIGKNFFVDKVCWYVFALQCEWKWLSKIQYWKHRPTAVSVENSRVHSCHSNVYPSNEHKLHVQIHFKSIVNVCCVVEPKLQINIFSTCTSTIFRHADNFGFICPRLLPPPRYNWGEKNFICHAHSSEKWHLKSPTVLCFLKQCPCCKIYCMCC